MLGFKIRRIHNQINSVVCKTVPKNDRAPQTQLQAGIMGYLYHHKEAPVYQKNIEEEFKISRATATNTLQIMEKNELIVRRALDKDARLKRIIMTEEAEKNHALVEKHMAVMDERMVQGMAQGEKQELMRLLDIVLANLEFLEQEVLSDKEQDNNAGACF